MIQKITIDRGALQLGMVLVCYQMVNGNPLNINGCDFEMLLKLRIIFPMIAIIRNR